MGILKSLDFMDESKSIRSVYREAFKAIVVEAVKSIDNPVDLELAKVSSSHQSSRQSSDSEADGGALIEQHTFNHFWITQVKTVQFQPTLLEKKFSYQVDHGTARISSKEQSSDVVDTEKL